MSRLVIVVDASTSTIGDLNDKCQHDSPNDAMIKLANYFTALAGGNASGEVEVTTRDDDVSVTTSGTGSTQKTHDLK